MRSYEDILLDVAMSESNAIIESFYDTVTSIIKTNSFNSQKKN